jgi:hypothetical protein
VIILASLCTSELVAAPATARLCLRHPETWALHAARGIPRAAGNNPSQISTSASAQHTKDGWNGQSAPDACDLGAASCLRGGRRRRRCRRLHRRRDRRHIQHMRGHLPPPNLAPVGLIRRHPPSPPPRPSDVLGHGLRHRGALHTSPHNPLRGIQNPRRRRR